MNNEAKEVLIEVAQGMHEGYELEVIQSILNELDIVWKEEDTEDKT